ncbi:uncharacterized protein LOC114542893 [Dendronephthya gigantea]|uniref:uncharacterized protein LOC114542893 n=1 Tax=Dendronephthya gigantea TaxID=151771 RepID=UPI00106A239B|nr:uncharacterized protein LOC114542893 [Dendronephthya gigantea]
MLKPKQVICLEKVFFNSDVLAVLPTGYGKSLIFYLLPALLFAAKNGVAKYTEHIDSIIVVVSPLNALMKDQISRLNAGIIRASVLDVRNVAAEDSEDAEDKDDGIRSDVVCDFPLNDKIKLEEGYYNIVFAHPESLVSCLYGRRLMRSIVYQKNVCAIVVDESHCILEWGKDFRVDYGNLGALCATFSNVPVIAMTATANRYDRDCIKKSLGLKSCVEIIGNPDRMNITYKKHFRTGPDIDSLTEILTPIAEGLKKQQMCYPLTIIYIPLKWCGFAYKLFEFVLGCDQYYPKGGRPIPENRLFAQFHSPQTKEMKDEVLKQLTCATGSTIRVVFATVALGMGVDIKGIRSVVHITPPYTIQAYVQETGRAGRDGNHATAVLYYNNRDVAKNKPGMQEDIRVYCQNRGTCLRYMLLKSMDTDERYIKPLSPKHFCCSVCGEECDCASCTS